MALAAHGAALVPDDDVIDGIVRLTRHLQLSPAAAATVAEPTLHAGAALHTDSTGDTDTRTIRSPARVPSRDQDVCSDRISGRSWLRRSRRAPCLPALLHPSRHRLSSLR